MREHFERLIAIGDIHGCVHALDVLLGKIAPTSSDRLVFQGDLIDQGRDSSAVLDRLTQLQRQCDVVLIKDNHEEMILAARESESALRYWENCGGVATLNSYRFGAVLRNYGCRSLGNSRNAAPQTELPPRLSYQLRRAVHDSDIHLAKLLRWAKQIHRFGEIVDLLRYRSLFG